MLDVPQARRGLGLTPEALPLLRTGIGAGQEHLEGDVTVKAPIPRPVHHAHAAMAQLVLHLVAAELRWFGGPRLGGLGAANHGRGRRQQRVELGLEPVQMPEACPDLGQQLRAVLADLFRA